MVALLVALPLLAPAVMPAVFADDDPEWIAALMPDTPDPPPLKGDRQHFDPPANPGAAPTVAPEGIAAERPVPEAGFENAQPGPGLVDGVLDPSVIVAPPPPPVQRQPIRVGHAVRAPTKIRDVKPVYPQIVQAARVEGVVIIEATIGVDGRMLNARILRSLPLLDQAALEAVRQWEFTPTLLNGVPVPVIMTVTVNFTLK